MSDPMIGVMIFVAVTCLVLIMVRTVRKQEEQGRQIRQRLGFSPVEPVDPGLVQRVSTIEAANNQKAIVSKVYKRDYGSYVLYDCRIKSSRNSESDNPSSVIVGQGWRLPSIRITPTLGGAGKAWNLLNRFALLAVKHSGFEQVELRDQLEFSKKYHLLTRSSQVILQAVPGEVWRDLASLQEQFFLQAEGDTVIFFTLETLTNRIKGDYETRETGQLKRTIDTAARLADVFNGCRTREINESVLR